MAHRVGFLLEEIGFFQTFERNWKKGFFPTFFHFFQKKVEETPKCQFGTITKFAVKGFLCILIQYYRFGWIFTLICNKILHFSLTITNYSFADKMFIILLH